MVLLNESIRTTSDRGVQRMKAEEKKFLPNQKTTPSSSDTIHSVIRSGGKDEIRSRRAQTRVQRTKDKGSKSPQTKPIIKPEGYGTTTTYVPLDTASIELRSHPLPMLFQMCIFKRGCNPIPIQVFSFNDRRVSYYFKQQTSWARDQVVLLSFTQSSRSSHLIKNRMQTQLKWGAEPWPQRKSDAINVATDKI